MSIILGKSFPIEWPLLWFRIGWLGVDLFFVISGFVITLSASQLFESYGSKFYKIYCKRRLARIVPLYILTGFFFIFLCEPSILSHAGFYRSLIYYLLFVHNLDANTFSTINGPNWTVAVEMQFYILIMIAIPYLVCLHPLVILLGCIIVSWVWRALSFLILCGNETCNAGIIFIPFVQLLGCLDEFGFGIFLCRMVLDRNGRFFKKLSVFGSSHFRLANF